MNEQTRPQNAAPQDNSEADLANMTRDQAAACLRLRATMQAKAKVNAAIWDTLSARLREQIGEGDFTRWFKEAKATFTGTTEGVVLRLAFPTRFMCDWVETHYGVYVSTLWQQKERSGRIEFVVLPTPPAEKKTEPEPPTGTAPALW